MNKENKQGLYVLIAIGILGILALIAFTGNKPEEEKVVGHQVDRIVKEQTYKTEDPINDFRDNFIGGCMDEDGTYSECDCMYKELIKEYGERDFLEMSVDFYLTGELPSRALMAVLNCY
jgi:hypothetical protein